MKNYKKIYVISFFFTIFFQMKTEKYHKKANADVKLQK